MLVMKIAILGASRGLGKALVESAPSSAQLWLASRKINEAEFQTEAGIAAKVTADFSKPEQFSDWVGSLQEFQPESVIYCAGGGPYGSFGSLPWHSHQWALQVTQLTPMQLVHWCLNQSSLPQVVCIGSAIAEAAADPNASSYAASKHALKGFHSSVVAENSEFDFRLFSPGYMDTDLLPPGCPPRQNGDPIADPKQVAVQFWQWLAAKDNFQNHYLLSPPQS